jgi:hypothetical protein
MARGRAIRNIEDGTKQCTKCGEWKPNTLEYFKCDNRLADGICYICRKCYCAYYKKIRDEKRGTSNKPPRHAIENGMRRCTICGETKPATKEFYYRVHGGCRLCYNKRLREWYNSPEKVEQRLLKKQQRHADAQARRRVKQKERYQANKEHILASQKSDEHFREYQRKYQRERQKAQPERYRAYQANRRARKMAAGGEYTKEDVQLLYQSQKGLCWWCSEPVGNAYHVDHRIPLSKGGSNDPRNLCISCPTCNTSKNDKLPHEWNGRLL